MRTGQKEDIYNFRNEGPERREIVFGIARIYMKLLRSRSEKYLDDEMLAELRIVVSHMSLQTGKSDAIQDPFFVPLNRQLLDEQWANMRDKLDWPKPGFFIITNFHAAARVEEFATAIAEFNFTKPWKSRG